MERIKKVTGLFYKATQHYTQNSDGQTTKKVMPSTEVISNMFGVTY